MDRYLRSNINLIQNILEPDFFRRREVRLLEADFTVVVVVFSFFYLEDFVTALVEVEKWVRVAPL